MAKCSKCKKQATRLFKHKGAVLCSPCLTDVTGKHVKASGGDSIMEWGMASLAIMASRPKEWWRDRKNKKDQRGKL